MEEIGNITCAAVYEAVTAYAIDDPYVDDEKSSLLLKIGLTLNMFYDENSGLYVNRDKIKDLKEKILFGNRIILVFGYPGTGKTTIIWKALNDIQKIDECLIIHFDFRARESLLGSKSEEYLEVIINDQLFAEVINFCLNKGIPNSKIISFFISPSDEKYVMSRTFIELKSKLFEEYIPNKNIKSFKDWFDGMLINPTSKINRLVEQLIKSLRLRDYMYFINHGIKKENVIRIIVLFDNIDSIFNNKVREDLIILIRNYHGHIGDCAKIIFSSRTPTLAKHAWPDYGAHIADDIEIDYGEFLDETEFNKKREYKFIKTGSCDAFDELDIVRDLQFFARQNFTEILLGKRTEYLEKLKSIDSFKFLQEIECEDIKNLYKLLTKPSSRIAGPLFELSNYDRRIMFLHLCNLVRFIHKVLNRRVTEFGKTESERQFILESIFYNSLNDQENIFQFQTFNIFGELQNFEIEKDHLPCSLSYLIISVIYKLTNRERGKHNYSSSKPIKDVLARLADIGYDKEVVRARLLNLYKNGDQYHGLIETSKYTDIKEIGDLHDDYPIWLTPRSAHLCEFLSHKYLYLQSCLRKNGWISMETKFDYRDENPITLNSIKTILDFLCFVASIHTGGLIKIRELLSKKYKSWYEHYLRWYCISSVQKEELLGGGYYGDLQLNNILRSHIKFLERQSKLNNYGWISDNNVLGIYKKLSELFMANVKYIKENNDNMIITNYRDKINLDEFASEAS